jgi:hypothetical protein
MTFLAAMFVPGFYTDSVARSWAGVLSALRNHQLLTRYVTHCIGTFETLWARILEPRSSSPLDIPGASLSADDLGFVFDIFYDAGLNTMGSSSDDLAEC